MALSPLDDYDATVNQLADAFSGALGTACDVELLLVATSGTSGKDTARFVVRDSDTRSVLYEASAPPFFSSVTSWLGWWVSAF